MSAPTVLATIPGNRENERLQVVLTVGGNAPVALVQQSWTAGVGWYNQASLHLTSEQLSQLRAALGLPQNRSTAPLLAAPEADDAAAILRFPREGSRAESA